MTTRFATSEDSAVVFEFICDLEETHFDYSLFEKYFNINLSNKDYIYLVAVNDEGGVVGFLSCHGQILLHHVSKVFEIQELFVNKEYRSQKVGYLLLEKLEEILKKNNYIFLEVTSNMKRIDAHRFYINNGFNQTHYRFTKTLST